jgi:aconitate hydratase
MIRQNSNPDQKLIKGNNNASLPVKEPLGEQMDVPVGIKLGDSITTDHLAPAKADHYRSNIPKLAEYCLSGVDESYSQRAKEYGTSAIVAGDNYGQGSSREHAALAPLELGVEVVISKGFARIHKSNLINFGILPLKFVEEDDYEQIDQNDRLFIDNVRAQLDDELIEVKNTTNEKTILTQLDVSDRQRQFLKAGGKLPYIRDDF